MMAEEPRTNRIPFMLSDAELAAIDGWRFANKIATRAEAIRRLCQIALASSPLLTRRDEKMVDFEKAVSDWLDEQEGFSQRRERLYDDVEAGQIILWLIAAYRLGYEAAVRTCHNSAKGA